jgi:hypothetical protein
MKWIYRIGLAVSALTVALGVTPAAASAADVNIEANYYWNADGYTGTLDVYSVASDGAVQATLSDNGQIEQLSGTWTASAGRLDITRPLAGGVVQFYSYWLGGKPYNSDPIMLAGYYTANVAGYGDRGAYLDSVWPAAPASQASHTASANNFTIETSYFWNADGETGTFDIFSLDANGNVVGTLDHNGMLENLTGVWNPSDGVLFLNRSIAGGQVQNYVYFLGGGLYNSNQAEFGGYYNVNGSQPVRGSYLDSAR